MCIYINQKLTDDFKRCNRKERITVYKQVKVTDKVRTLYQQEEVSGGWFKADDESYIYYDYIAGYCLSYGAIHCYRKPIPDWPEYGYYTLKCWAYAKDFIACNENEIAFSKIFVPADEIARVKKLDYEHRKIKVFSRFSYS